jgi:hypothetical protein
LTIEPSSRTAFDRSEFKLNASLDLVEAEADSTPKPPPSARAMLTPSAMTTVRRRSKGCLTRTMSTFAFVYWEAAA